MVTIALVVVAVVLGVDLGIKYYVEKHMKSSEERSIWKGRGIVRKVHNHGMILNSLDKHPQIVKKLSVSGLGMLLVWMIFVLKKTGHTGEKLGAAMMTGGALSNTFDRVKRGYVVDYLAFKTPNKKLTDITYNLGDFAIFGGALLMVIGAFIAKER